jgi:hypothetical protein
LSQVLIIIKIFSADDSAQAVTDRE